LKLKTDQESEILLSSFNSVPQATFRCNTFRISREDLIESLKKDSIKAHATAYSPDGLIVTNGNPFKTKSFTEGLFIPQDEASQLITHFLDPAQDSRILDLCCGSGIKTSHLVALTEKKSHIVSVDLTRKKIESAKNLMKKLFETDVPVLFEKKNAASDLQYGEFDFVMIDAPCSGLGTLRRRPDMRIKKIKPDLRTLSDLQYRILLNAARHVKKAGVLLYAVCTVTQEETFEIVKRFLKETKGRFVVEPVRKEFMSPFISKHGFLIINPLKHDMDGFFAARFRNVFERT
jgi:16S rRNA (cytosine967-C5)-methyltransferase